MSEYHKCTCPHCAQSIEYPAEGAGQTVPCPTCEKPFVLLPDIVIPSTPPKVAQAQTRKPEEADRAAYVERVRSEPATEKQKEKLRYFGYTVNPGMTKGEASDAIDECIRLHPEKDREYYDRPATEEQMAKLKKFAETDEDMAIGLQEVAEEGSQITYGQAKDWLWQCEMDARKRRELAENEFFFGPPSKAQCDRIRQLGFKLDKTILEKVTGADVELILGLSNVQPAEPVLRFIRDHGMTFTSGDALAAFALTCLIRSLGGPARAHNRKDVDYGSACQAASRDPAFRTPTLTLDWEGELGFAWPKETIQYRSGFERPGHNMPCVSL